MPTYRLRRAGLLLGLLSCLLFSTVSPALAVPSSPYNPYATFTIDTDLTTPSGWSTWAIDAFLAAQTDLPPLGAAFMAAERNDGINARCLVALAMHESGFGSSYLSQAKYNLFGFNANDDNPIGDAAAFAGYADGIAQVADFIKTHYLTPGGSWWGGAATLRAMNIHYATDPSWGAAVAAVANQIPNDTLRARGVTFGTPVLQAHAQLGLPITLVIPASTVSGASVPPALQYLGTWIPQSGIDAAPLQVMAAAQGVDSTGVYLHLATPVAAGMYILELQVQDSDGSPLAASDQVSIPPLILTLAPPLAVSYEARLASVPPATPTSEPPTLPLILTAGASSEAPLPLGTNAANAVILAATLLPLDVRQPALTWQIPAVAPLLGLSVEQLAQATDWPVTWLTPDQASAIWVLDLGAAARRALPAVLTVNLETPAQPDLLVQSPPGVWLLALDPGTGQPTLMPLAVTV